MFFTSTTTTTALLFVMCVVLFSANGLTITTAEQLITFSNDVNKGTSYSGSTVYLGSDISFTSSLSQQFQPIGKTTTSYFNGTFDGQGHTISNLAITTPSSSLYTGLFGYSGGATIKNVVMDSSCSVVSSSVSTSSLTHAGSVIGKCETVKGGCLVENCVNMGSVTFSGNVQSDNLRLGGIAGELYYSTYSISIRNCANYGAIVKTGPSYYAWIGGVVGLFSEDSYYKYVQNCANYGSITHSGSTSFRLGIGGIVSLTEYVKIDNCLSAGKISSSNYPSDNKQGAIVGWVDPSTYIEYCHFTSDVGFNSLYGTSSPYTPSSTTGSSSSSVSLDSALLNKLNNRASSNSWNKWLLNTNKAKVTFKVNDYKGFALSSQLILLPDLAATGSKKFKGWFTDSSYSTLHPYTISGSSARTFYGLYGSAVTVTFNGNGGSSSQQTKSVLYGEKYGILPTPVKTGYVFTGWFTEKDEGKGTKVTQDVTVVTSSSHTLYAHWTIGSYTITFETNGGESIDPITSQYLSVVNLPNVTKKGKYEFKEWVDENGNVASWQFTVPGRNVVLHAAWVLRIRDVSELVSFSNNVNSGTSYFWGTVYLDSDIDFTSTLSQQFQPIGKTTTNFFNGIFDGQGHAIRNLALSSSLQFVGLFIYSEGVTIRNVVMDSSCSVTSTYNSTSNDWASVGGILGKCYSYTQCNIENCVNMGSVSFGKDSSGYALFLGGIVGWSDPSNYIYIKNCVNYGSITQYGTNRENSFFGGMNGYTYGSINRVVIQNCANFGTLSHNGTTSKSLYMGGIKGYGYNIVENCLNAGKIISTFGTASGTKYLGAIVGLGSDTIINYCHFTSDVGVNNLYGGGSPSVTGSSSSPVSLDSNLMNNLNTQATSNSTWSKWFMLHLNGGRINNLNKEILIVTQKHFPDPVKEGPTFSFWYKDAKFAERYDPETTDITGVTDLYAQYISDVAITFDFGNGTKTTKTVTYGRKYGTLPSPGERTGYTFDGWFTKENGQGEKATEETTVRIPNDHTLYAHWSINNYTITFVFNNGIENEVRVLNFNETIIYPENVVKEGYTFAGWSPKPVRMPAKDVTIIAQWTINNYTITFVFDNGTGDEARVLNFNETIVYPEDPTKEGHSFNGWSPRPVRMLAEDVTVTAQWTANNYTISFEFWNGTKTTKTVAYGESYGTLPSAGERTGHTFAGWFTEEEEGERVAEETIMIIASDHTLYAHWTINNYTITFIFNNGTENEVRVLNYNETIVYPENVVKEGHTFNGWSPKPVRMPAKDITVTAQWTINNYTITFIFNNGDEDEEMILDFNELIDYPENASEKEGYTFNGWSPRPERMPAENINTVAHWTANNYTISFDFGNGTKTTVPMNVTYGRIYGTLPEGTRTGHTFDGWFTEENGQGEKVTEETIVSIPSDHTLYAHWTINNYTITFVFNNDAENDVRVLNFNETIVYPEDPTKEGFTFNGWSPRPVRMPAKDITVTAQWIEKPTEFVEIVFGRKDLKEEEVREILEEYTQEEFIIERFEVDNETGEVRVIVKFVDISKAAEFVRNINEKEGSSSSDNLIKGASVVSENNSSFSLLFTPILFNLFFV